VCAWEISRLVYRFQNLSHSILFVSPVYKEVIFVGKKRGVHVAWQHQEVLNLTAQVDHDS
jgi:hypothetical protein